MSPCFVLLTLAALLGTPVPSIYVNRAKIVSVRFDAVAGRPGAQTRIALDGGGTIYVRESPAEVSTASCAILRAPAA